MLDYGYRSECCFAPIRMGFRKIKNVRRKVPVWVCCKCKKFDCEIVPKSSPPKSKFAVDIELD